MKSVYILGEVNRVKYRSETLIKILLTDNYQLYYNSIWPDHKIKADSKILGGIKKAVRIIHNILLFPFKVYLFLIADLVILPAMNTYHQFEFNLAAKILKKKVIVDYYVSYYDTYVLDRKIIPENSRRAKKLMRYDQNLLKNGWKVFFLTQTESKYYLKLAGLCNNNIDKLILPLFTEEKKKVALPFFHKRNKTFTICWWGSYIPLHGLEEIIGAVAILSKLNFNYRLYILGNSHQKSIKYADMVSKCKLNDRVIIINDLTLDNEKLQPFLVENCDLALGNFGQSEKAKSVLVNKLLDGIAMRAPVLTGQSLAANEFFDFKNDIWRCANNPEEIAESIIKISETKLEEIKRRVDNSYQIYQKYFTERVFKKNFRKIFRAL